MSNETGQQKQRTQQNVHANSDSSKKQHKSHSTKYGANKMHKKAAKRMDKSVRKFQRLDDSICATFSNDEFSERVPITLCQSQPLERFNDIEEITNEEGLKKGEGEEVEEERDIGKDFERLSNLPVSEGNHFIFKTEKKWTVDISRYSEFFTLNINNLTKHLECIPMTEYLDIDENYFTKDQLTSIRNKAEKAKELYCTLDESEEISLAKKSNPVVENKFFRDDEELEFAKTFNDVLIKSKNSRKEEDINDLEKDLDVLLNLKEPINDLSNKSKPRAEEITFTPIDGKSTPMMPKSIDLEKWLDSVLSD